MTTPPSKFLTPLLAALMLMLCLAPAAEARWYRADLGAWTRRDPVGLRAGTNLYSYVNNKAIVGVDPTGLIIKATNGAGSASCSNCNTTNSRMNPPNAPYAFIRMQPSTLPAPLCAPLPPDADPFCGERLLGKCLMDPNTGPEILSVLGEIANGGCPRPTIYCGSRCGAGNFPAVSCFDRNGGRDICINPSKTGDDACYTLLHELVHIKQFCADAPAPSDPTFPNYMNDSKICFQREMEAYIRSGLCNIMVPRWGVTYRQCICMGACGSCSAQFNADGTTYTSPTTGKTYTGAGACVQQCLDAPYSM